MGLDRDEILRDDFPTARRGYEPTAVRAHLRRVADAVENRGPRRSAPLAEAAADRVGSILEAAEEKAAEIEAEARRDAERIVSAARREAKEQVDRAQGAVNRLVEQADELRSAVGRLGSDIASQVGSAGGRATAARAETPAPEVVPEPARVPEPTPPREPEPQPPPTPEPQPPLEPEPQPPEVPEPQPPGPEVRAGSPSTEDLLAQLRGAGGAPAAEPARAAANGDERDDATGHDVAAARRAPGAADRSDADVAAARLVAMKMALEGASREEIARHLSDNYDLPRADELLDDVLARARP